MGVSEGLDRAGTSATVERCAEVVARHWADLIGRLSVRAEQMAELFAAGPLRSDDVRHAAQPLALDVLTDETLVGGGFVASPDALLDETHFLAWWQGENKEQLGDPTVTVQVTDYTRQEWFSVPRRTGRPHLTGPYIDYVCTDEFVMTTTVPVMVDGTMVGVFGADTLAETLEGLFEPVFRDSGCTLVNDHGRVVLSDDPEVFAGRLIDDAGFTHRARCAGVPLVVVAR